MSHRIDRGQPDRRATVELIARLSHPTDEMVEGIPGLVVTHRAGRVCSVERRTISAAGLEQMTPAERSAGFEASIVWNLDDAPESLVTRAREWAEARIAEEAHQPAE